MTATTILIAALIAGGSPQGLRYGESLLDATHIRHPALVAVQMDVTDVQAASGHDITRLGRASQESR